jgi:hypothetical protein
MRQQTAKAATVDLVQVVVIQIELASVCFRGGGCAKIQTFEFWHTFIVLAREFRFNHNFEKWEVMELCLQQLVAM